MFAQRSISWNAALRDLRDDRAKVPAGLAGTRVMAEVYGRARGLATVSGGRFDRAAIMTLATLAARHHQQRYGSTWADAMSVALKATWQIAKATKLKMH